MRDLIVLIVLAAVGMSAGAALYSSMQNKPLAANDSSAATQAPGFSVKDLDGVTRTEQDWAGKYQLLNFWATWCPPCRREIPMLKDLQTEYGERGLQVIGIAIDQLDAVAKYQQEIQMNYPVLVGQMDATKIADKYGNNIGALPYSVLVAPDGEILFSRMGELEHEPIVSVLESLPAFKPAEAE